MAKSANAGELRTPVFFYRIIRGLSPEAAQTVDHVPLFTKHVPVKWVNMHGSEVWQNQSLGLREPATLTMRYSPELCDIKLIVTKAKDDFDNAYEVVSVDNVEERNVWIEMKVQRMEAAR